MLATAFLVSTLAAAAPAAPISASAGPTLLLAPRDMFALAESAEAGGDERTATGAYEALSNDPNSDVRAEARFRLARLHARRGNAGNAAIQLRRVLDEKPDAAPVRLALARQLAALGNEQAALRELRAVRSGSLPPQVARLVDRFSEALRVRKPIGGSLEIALAPDSNISRSTRSDTLGTIFGDFNIDEDSKARSGTGIAVRAQAFRRIGIGESGDLLFRASGSSNLYRDGAYDDIALDLAAGPEFRLGASRISLEAGASAHWFGQKPYTRSLRIGGAIGTPIGARTYVRAGASASAVDNRRNALQDGKDFAAHARLERALSPTTGVVLSLTGERFVAKDPGYSTTGWRAGLLGWREVGRATLTASATMGRLSADERLSLFPDKRADRYSQLSVGATFRHFAYGGFAPVVRFTLERNRSNIAFYDWDRNRTEFGLSRAF